jgi:hypothetical protein
MSHNLNIHHVFIDDISQQNVSCQHLNVSGGLQVDGHIQLVDVSCQHLDVSGNATIGGTLQVDGHSQLVDVSCQHLDVSGNATIGGTLDVDGHSQLVDVSCQHLDVSGNATIDGTLDVSGNTTISGTLDVDSSLNVSGYVGVGLSSSETTTELLTIKNHNESMTSMSILANGEGSNSAIFFGTQHGNLITNTKKTAIIAEGKNNWSRANLHFCLQNETGNTNDDVDLNDSKMVITYSGNVGIGTTTPTTKLHVSGTMKVTESILLNSNIGLTNVTGQYGTVQTTGNIGNWGGYSINGRWVFMGNTGNEFGIYNDVDNVWAFKFDRGSGVGGPACTQNGGIIVDGYAVENDLGSGRWFDSGGGLYSNPPATRYSVYCSHGVKGYRIIASSDDRIKKNEKYISNAIESILKLKPQTYDKYSNFDCSGEYIFESGLIAQEIFYDAPELRHLVDIGKDNNLDLSIHINTSEEPSIDPDYSSWGSSIAGVNYNGLIPYCIQAIKEQQEIIQEEKTKVSTLQSQYNDLLSRVSALENSS